MLLWPDTSTSLLSIRPAQSGDDHFFQQLFAANHSYFANSGLPQPLAQQLLRQQYQLQQQSYQQQSPCPQVYLILLQQQPVGRLILARRPDFLHITDLALLPDFCGQGLGSELMTGLRQYAQQQQLGLQLLVEQQNDGALQFYRRHGFQCRGLEGNHFQLYWSPDVVSNLVAG
ncbi:GNAT family N-acetyltransferase [Rheinheimera sp. 4Y26]|uniref:GNAT family N-acetyltransferase n=1 Tax=Rheinheimera sp. 4Y26 TaxID=2977811 RepID=UPI0021B0A2FB|nr:GNAT family N-acetyltransferase [Rheinheimera sp. 4Y26]MCT6701053.1 GNAT family N-acetyltransferase [Rheinheimera sp. 4Y26]